MKDCILRPSFGGIFVEVDDIYDSLWVLPLLVVGNTILLQHALPFCRESLFNQSVNATTPESA